MKKKKEYWSGLPCPSPDLPNVGIEPTSPALQIIIQPLTYREDLYYGTFAINKELTSVHYYYLK